MDKEPIKCLCQLERFAARTRDLGNVVPKRTWSCRRRTARTSASRANHVSNNPARSLEGAPALLKSGTWVMSTVSASRTMSIPSLITLQAQACHVQMTAMFLTFSAILNSVSSCTMHAGSWRRHIEVSSTLIASLRIVAGPQASSICLGDASRKGNRPTRRARDVPSHAQTGSPRHDSPPPGSPGRRAIPTRVWARTWTSWRASSGGARSIQRGRCGCCTIASRQDEGAASSVRYV